MSSWPSPQKTSQWNGNVPAVTMGVSRGFHVARWTEGDLGYAAVSDMKENELRAFVDLVRN
jgi:anti-sigma factor RsiW